MKHLLYKTGCVAIAFLALIGCTDKFDEINTNPTTVYKIDPPVHFYQATNIMNNSSFEFYYDICSKQMPWMQYTVGTSGNITTTFDYISNQGDRYSRFVSSGGYVKDIEEYIKVNIPAEEQLSYANLILISKILRIYYGIYTSDTFGSLVYDEGWQARYGGITDPSFQQQEELYNEWDSELKTAIASLKENKNQISIGGNDVIYSGKVENWIKAANALRLRLATRWIKRDLEKAKSMAADVFKENTQYLFSSNNDGWVFRFETKFTGHDNFALIESYRATYSMINYMLENEDPRLRIFYKKNTYSKENVEIWNEQNPSNTLVYNSQQYIGGHSDPMSVNRTTSPEFYASQRKIKLADGTEETLDTLSHVQNRLFYAQSDKGTGISWMPGITYADFCFMAAEFSYYGVSSPKTTQAWYEEGVRSSLGFWSDMGKSSDVANYSSITDSEIETYMNSKAVVWDESKAMQKIASQAFIDYFKNVNETMSLWKRTGYPNTTTPLAVERLMSNTTDEIKIPRRHSFTYPMPGTNNYDNYKKRLDDMAKDPDFGSVDDATGRIWWDKK